uniref:Uncharacterized protein n=1 Tax=Trichuris muris TaxID=70415 RepID=A0A5S6QMR4_TRIMR
MTLAKPKLGSPSPPSSIDYSPVVDRCHRFLIGRAFVRRAGGHTPYQGDEQRQCPYLVCCESRTQHSTGTLLNYESYKFEGDNPSRLCHMRRRRPAYFLSRLGKKNNRRANFEERQLGLRVHQRGGNENCTPPGRRLPTLLQNLSTAAHEKAIRKKWASLRILTLT